MGNKSSSARPEAQRPSKQNQGTEKQENKPQPEKKKDVTSPAPASGPKDVDVVISASPADAALVSMLKEKLEQVSLSVYCNSTESPDAAKAVGKVLVDAKLLVFVASEKSAKSKLCNDQISLAYISNKPIVLAAKKEKDSLINEFSFGLRLTLQILNWIVFEGDQDAQGATANSFVQVVQESLNKPAVSETATVEASVTLESAGPSLKRNRARINTKLRGVSIASESKEPSESVSDSFWQRNFAGEDEVPWYRFQQVFLTDYDAKITSLFDEESVPWLLNMLKNDIFGAAEKITKNHFMNVRGDEGSQDRHAFWKVVSQIAVEKYNMQEVFNMDSSVRLTAIEKLAQYQSAGVIDALKSLLEDKDPNVRAVAAISLGRTGKAEESVVDALMGLLEDPDRIVRQSACLSLGSMKAVKAIPKLGHVWRNDFISVVRDAARSALTIMDLPEADKILRVTKILEDEVKTLAAGRVDV